MMLAWVSYLSSPRDGWEYRRKSGEVRFCRRCSAIQRKVRVFDGKYYPRTKIQSVLDHSNPLLDGSCESYLSAFGCVIALLHVGTYIHIVACATFPMYGTYVRGFRNGNRCPRAFAETSNFLPLRTQRQSVDAPTTAPLCCTYWYTRSMYEEESLPGHDISPSSALEKLTYARGLIRLHQRGDFGDSSIVRDTRKYYSYLLPATAPRFPILMTSHTSYIRLTVGSCRATNKIRRGSALKNIPFLGSSPPLK